MLRYKFNLAIITVWYFQWPISYKGDWAFSKDSQQFVIHKIKSEMYTIKLPYMANTTRCKPIGFLHFMLMHKQRQYTYFTHAEMESQKTMISYSISNRKNLLRSYLRIFRESTVYWMWLAAEFWWIMLGQSEMHFVDWYHARIDGCGWINIYILAALHNCLVWRCFLFSLQTDTKLYGYVILEVAVVSLKSQLQLQS